LIKQYCAGKDEVKRKDKTNVSAAKEEPQADTEEGLIEH
jgi:hypothetical protein